MIPESERSHNDLIDIVIEAAQKVVEVEQPDGQYAKQLELDPQTIWWKTQIVNSPTFGRAAYAILDFESLGEEASNFMHKDRAAILQKQIISEVKNFRYSIDAKSSESLRDKNNSQSTLIDKINRNKIEKAYTVKNEAGKSIWDGLIGREEEKDND